MHMTETIRSANELIRDIEDMKIRGAFRITGAVLEALTLRANEIVGAGEPLRDAMIVTAERLTAAQPSMASVANACAYVLAPFRTQGTTLSDAEMYRLIVTRSQAFVTAFEQAQRKVTEVGARLVHDDDVVFVHSYSGTLLGILEAAHENGRSFSVIATESRPYCEGREMVYQLLQRNIPCTLIIDAAMGTYIGRATKALVGADAILANGNLVNKMGTQLLALACTAQGIPLYAAGMILKLSTASLRGDEVGLLERPDDAGIAPPELPSNAPLQVKNRIFDVTPARFIEALITDQGVIPPAAVAGFRDNPFLQTAAL